MNNDMLAEELLPAVPSTALIGSMPSNMHQHVNILSMVPGRRCNAYTPVTHTPVPGNAPFLLSTTKPRSCAMYPFIRFCNRYTPSVSHYRFKVQQPM